jgi:hypothetical protein
VEFTSSLGSFYACNSTLPGSGIKDAYVPSLESCLVGTRKAEDIPEVGPVAEWSEGARERGKGFGWGGGVLSPVVIRRIYFCPPIPANCLSLSFYRHIDFCTTIAFLINQKKNAHNGRQEAQRRCSY